MMVLSSYSLLGALIFLVLGIVELVFIRRAIYPALRWRYEVAKTTQSQGLDPARVMSLVRFQSLVLMPLLGLMLGGPIKSILGEAP
jgi:membrane protein YdbS with pleckstrin-like domain